jgi:UDP-N-acetylmuramoyl-tripeptide--D-alanyl-D-alanine ligase
LNFDQIILVGSEFGKVVSSEGEILHFQNAEQAKQWFFKENLSGATILLKGSRGIGLEKILSD